MASYPSTTPSAPQHQTYTITAGSAMDPYNATTNSNRDFECINGRSVIPRRLPPLPSLPSLRTESTSSSASSSPPSSVFSLSPTSSGSSSPASSPASLSPDHSPTKSLNALKRVSRPLPQIPASRGTPNPSQSSHLVPTLEAQLIVCRSCMSCITTSESLLPASSIPPGTRAFRGFSGKASLFTEVYNVNASPARVQLMTTGAHTMQETFCANCSVYLGWRIVKAHERSEKWKEGKWLLELENLWLAKNSDILDPSFEKAVEHEHERERERGMERELPREPRGRRVSNFGAASREFPKDAARMVKAAREKGLGTVKGYAKSSGHHHYSQSTPNFMRAYHGSGSAIHLPMTIAT